MIGKKGNLKVTFVHDLFFDVDSCGRLFCPGGLDEIYFDRFFDSGFHKVKIISRSNISTKSLSNYFQPDKFEFSKFKFSDYGELFSFSAFNALRIELKKSDLVVISMPSITGCYVAMLCAIIGIPYVVEVVGDGEAFKAKRFGTLFTLFLRAFMPSVIGRASGAIYVSKYLSTRFINTKRTLVSSNVNISTVIKRKKITRKLIDKDQINLAFVGALNKNKGFDVLLNSISILVKRHKISTIILHAVGGREDFDVRSVIDKLGIRSHVKTYGFLSKDQVMDLLKDMDIYAQPSLSEGLPRATLESMSVGLPVVATSLPGFREILSDYSLIAPGNSDDLAEKLIEFIFSAELCSYHSLRNTEKAGNFLYNRLHKKRCDFYSNFKI
ncbi:glycosyltransferase involved in cell wall biosynthesis [Idiomarina fontislapidosi]|uniref:Glycosyl transferase family 1 domain-containing protein n=1 Tax=Idiomarina fontislapidosi TaxID=263723 RepID=A0A432XG63_9GAMM|nr:glycosyltransferase [Idiomarina fontislapidosi]PYE30106.1 glycosyltransferase involved in cell wall biosynthesis [Idiomarina fontislapidosi]RUO47596.1 hypothetical protein CWE25_13335 [Idiomarina fontislapidosi]